MLSNFVIPRRISTAAAAFILVIAGGSASAAAGPEISQSTVSSVPEWGEEPVAVATPPLGGVTVGVIDYTLDGRYVSSIVRTIDAPHGSIGRQTTGAPTVFDTGNETLPAPSARTGCRTVWTEVWDGSLWEWHRIRNTLYFCYNKTTLKVSSASTSWNVVRTDGMSLINPLTTTTNYYTYHSGVSSSGYRSQRTWTASREAEGAPHWIPV